MARHPVVAEVADVVHSLYPPGGAADWDAIGLVCGDPQARVERILFAVDPVAAVAEEARANDAAMLLTHHPLFLRGVNSVAATTPKGRLVHQLISNGIALQVAHTNADHADPGVSDALGAALGLDGLGPLAAQPAPAMEKVIVFVPEGDTETVFHAMAAAGAGSLGDYTECSWRSSGIGTFRPGAAANPAIGSAGALEQVDEHRLEMVLPRSARGPVLAAMRAAHPYEEVAFDLLELLSEPGTTGTGRIGELPAAESLSTFSRRVAAALPGTPGGVRVAGDPDRQIRRVAVCGGSGDSLLGRVNETDADVFVTADLRHHPASEHVEGDGPALIDVAHWSSEWPWLPVAARQLAAALEQLGTTVETHVSTTPTDPWQQHVAMTEPNTGLAPMQEGRTR